jgi:hypothetical protein
MMDVFPAEESLDALRIAVTAADLARFAHTDGVLRRNVGDHRLWLVTASVLGRDHYAMDTNARVRGYLRQLDNFGGYVVNSPSGDMLVQIDPERLEREGSIHLGHLQMHQTRHQAIDCGSLIIELTD